MSITFTKSSTSVIISKNPSYDSDFWHDRKNQSSTEMADGANITYDNGPDVLYGIIVLKNVSSVQAESLRTFIRSTLVYCLNSFTIVPPSNTDIGAGNGVTLSDVYLYDTVSTKDVFERTPPGIFNITIKYRKVL